MTVFVVSLYLPYTVSFHTKQTPDRQETLCQQHPPALKPSSYDVTAPIPNLFTSLGTRNGAGGPTPPETPYITTDPQEFFFKYHDRSGVVQLPIPDPNPLALSDPHLPTYIQTSSRSNSPPLSPLLKLAGVNDRRHAYSGRRRGSGHSSDFHSKVLADAEWTVEAAGKGNGGLRNAVRAAHENGSLQDRTWVGTLGMTTDFLGDTPQKTDIEDRLGTEFDSLVVFVKDSDFDGHYSHYCKQILWPVFHYQIPDNPKSKAYEDHSWVYYVNVNQAFADTIVRNYKRGDVIWVHDYHLLLVPAMVRKKLPDAQIGFFLHVAFPSSEVFRCLAVRKELLEGMLGSNLVGFQTEEYGRHFLQTCNRLLCVEATNEGVQLEDRFVNIATLPIGIDPISLSSTREGAAVEEWIQVIKERYRGKKLIVGRDKLDHVRGVRQKMLSYELFLNKYPQWRDKTVLIQVATSTTEQAELVATVSDIVTRVNSTHATLAHQPLVFLKQDISFAQYIALLTVADCLMITSQREGMNLTSHEFIFCQDGKYADNRHGPLILSEFTGTASLFGGSELSVNPWDYRQCADAIKAAVEMKPKERERRWLKLFKDVMHHTGAHWLKSFTDTLSKVWNEQQARGTISIPRLSVNVLGDQYKRSQRRLFILDYEGTLAPWGSPTSIILTSPQRTLDVLNDILLDEKNVVYVMSGRRPEELDRLFRRVPNLGLIAENGCFIKEFGSDEWIEMVGAGEVNNWKKSVTGIIDYYRERTPGAWVEHRHCSILYHYKNAEDLQAAARQAGDCTNHINDSCESQRVHAIPVDGAVLVESMDWSKGTAASQVLERLKEKKVWMPDFLMVAGDDREDEPIFRWANTLGKDKAIESVTTVSVGSRNTEAISTLMQGVTGVLSALQKLAALS
ncbi:MAG: hypothetical protein M1840_001002 [Geoglossum simile]|nr:MAG: hypothetical protein M1840_001002 [Geoglossum simile]